jgi:hypothetical protein
MPLYADKQWVKPLTQEEIEEYNKEKWKTNYST